MNGKGEVFWAHQDHRLFVNRRLGAWRKLEKKKKRKEGEDGNEHDGWHPLIEFLSSALARYAVSPRSG